jgi:hypothetical protein
MHLAVLSTPRFENDYSGAVVSDIGLKNAK